MHSLQCSHRIAPRRGLIRQLGFTMIELMIAIGVIGAALAIVFAYQGRTENTQSASKTASDVNMMASKIKSYLSSSNTYAAVTPSWVNSSSLVTEPMKYDGTNLLDPWGNTMLVSGNTTTFAITIGGTTSALDKEVCVSMASKLADNATAINIGTAATATAGVVSSGTVYKAIGGTADGANLAIGCNTATPVIALQFR